MKTPLQELIEDIEKNDSYFLEFGTSDCPIKRIHAKATELLENEREDIESAFDYGVNVGLRGGLSKDAEQYFNETYNQNK